LFYTTHGASLDLHPVTAKLDLAKLLLFASEKINYLRLDLHLKTCSVDSRSKVTT